jgi:hypothetical protein
MTTGPDAMVYGIRVDIYLFVNSLLCLQNS